MKRVFTQIGVIHGEPVFCWEKIAPQWYWNLQRLQLFAGIVWRDFHGVRIGFRTAWEVSRVALGRTV